MVIYNMIYELKLPFKNTLPPHLGANLIFVDVGVRLRGGSGVARERYTIIATQLAGIVTTEGFLRSFQVFFHHMRVSWNPPNVVDAWVQTLQYGYGYAMRKLAGGCSILERGHRFRRLRCSVPILKHLSPSIINSCSPSCMLTSLMLI
jgi:hypothetical protein